MRSTRMKDSSFIDTQKAIVRRKAWRLYTIHPNAGDRAYFRDEALYRSKCTAEGKTASTSNEPVGHRSPTSRARRHRVKHLLSETRVLGTRSLQRKASWRGKVTSRSDTRTRTKTKTKTKTVRALAYKILQRHVRVLTKLPWDQDATFRPCVHGEVHIWQLHNSNELKVSIISRRARCKPRGYI